MTLHTPRLALVLVLASAATAHAAATPFKCQIAISKASAGFVQVWAKAEQKCRDAIVKGKLPAATNCEFDVKVNTAANKATAKMQKTINKACGGKDKICGTGDADEFSLSAIGWNIGACPNFDNDGCDVPIVNCGSIVSCVRCIGDISVDQALELAYDSLTPTDPKAQKPLNKCQSAIGKAMAKLMTTKSKALAKCWASLPQGRTAAACPNPKAVVTIEKARAKKDAAIAKACQGPDKALGTPDDFTPAAIGFSADCFADAVPSCALAVATLPDLMDCLGCVSEHDIDCADAAAVPVFTIYPGTCNPGQMDVE